MHTRAMHRVDMLSVARTVLVLAAATLVSLGSVVPSRAEAESNRAEQILFDAANQERAARGLSTLRWDSALANAARRHALLMMSEGALSHQFVGEADLAARVRQTGARFMALAENVAEGRSAAGVHQQWMLSPPHRENLLDPELNAVGIAVAEHDGMLFAVEDFSAKVATVSFNEQEQQIVSELQFHGLSVLRDARIAGMARDACEGQPSLAAPAGRRIFLFRYATANLKTLPSALERELEISRYRQAVVAACSPAQDADWSGYQIAVLLYR